MIEELQGSQELLRLLSAEELEVLAKASRSVEMGEAQAALASCVRLLRGAGIALTDRRVIVVTHDSVQSHGPIAFAHMMSTRRKDGRGDIRFMSGALNGRDDDPLYSSELLAVDNPAHVESLIRVTLKPALIA